MKLAAHFCTISIIQGAIVAYIRLLQIHKFNILITILMTILLITYNIRNRNRCHGHLRIPALRIESTYSLHETNSSS